MLKRDNIITGILISFILPAIAWVAEFILNKNIYLLNRPAVPYFVAIALNLVVLRFFLKRDADLTARGLMLGTFIFMLFILFKVHPLR